MHKTGEARHSCVALQVTSWAEKHLGLLRTPLSPAHSFALPRGREGSHLAGQSWALHSVGFKAPARGRLNIEAQHRQWWVGPQSELACVCVHVCACVHMCVCLVGGDEVGCKGARPSMNHELSPTR